MHSNAIDLKDFYDSSQGRVVQRVLRQRLRQFWPDVKGCRVLGMGYAVPFLRPLMGEAERVLALMSSRQGPVFWPPEEKNLVALCDEKEWPIETNSIDRLFVVHGIPGYESLDSVLRESWRVLTGQGRLLLIVPNRTGVWARLDSTPFGHGAPYSQGQIRQSLRQYMFVPERAERALFVPPFASRLMLATAPLWEKLGQRFFNAFGGVNMVEASKQLYAGTPLPVSEAAAQLVRRRQIVMPTQRTGIEGDMS